MKKCRGFGETVGKCKKEANEAGFFCTECNEKRMTYINKQFDDLVTETKKHVKKRKVRV